jgi:hypothetical protein
MRKFCLAAVAAITVSLGAASAQEAANNPLIVWQGAAEVTSLSAGCSTLGYQIGDVAISVFRPRLDPAEPSSAITLTFHRAGHAFFRTGGTSTDQMQGNSNYSSPWYSGRATSTPGGNTGTINLQVKPNTAITATTDIITLQGSVTKFHGLSTCTMGFKAAYRLRP